jgi:hypothetical protein
MFADVLIHNALQLAFGTQGYTSTLRKLHTVSFNIRNTKRRKIAMDTQKATDIIMQGPPQLRRLAINDMQWEVNDLLNFVVVFLGDANDVE